MAVRARVEEAHGSPDGPDFRSTPDCWGLGPSLRGNASEWENWSDRGCVFSSELLVKKPWPLKTDVCLLETQPCTAS